MLNDQDVERALIITAHPDDLDFGAGGTIASWVQKGVDVQYCICTDGDAGGFDPAVARSEIPGIRRAEQHAAGAMLGVKDIHFLGHPDGRLTPSIDLRRDISRVIRQVRPQRVLCQSPDRNYQRIYASHPDHLAAGEAALCAVYPDARNPFAHPELASEGHEAWSVAETWVMAGTQPTYGVDITEFFDLKIAALRRHVSQTEHMDDLEERMRDWATVQARAMGFPEGHLVESFLIIDTV